MQMFTRDYACSYGGLNYSDVIYAKCLQSVMLALYLEILSYIISIILEYQSD